MNVLSLFDGMSCGQIAMQRLGIKIDNYFASEIDIHAIKTSKIKFPNTIHLGSVTKVFAKDLPNIDILIGGSPCQGFSFAGKGLNFNDPRSALFFEYVRLLKEIRETTPAVLFLLENVRMKKEHEDVISRILEIQPININSALVSAQNRERLYWTNIGIAKRGLFDDNYCTIPQPKDREIFLRDILQPPDEIDDKYYLSIKAIKAIKGWNAQQNPLEGIDTNDRKVGALTARGNHDMHSGLKLCYDEITIINKGGDIKPNQNKAGCFTAGVTSGGNHSDMDLIVHNTMPHSSKAGKGGSGHLSCKDGKTYCLDTGNTNAIEIFEESHIVAMRGRNPDNPNDRTVGSPTEQQLEPRHDGKTNCITNVAKDNLVREVIQINESKESGGKQPYQQNRVYDIDGIAPALNAGLSTGSNYIEIKETENYIQWEGNGFKQDNVPHYPDGKSGTIDIKPGRQKVLLPTSIIRRLTPIEVCRLQTIDDEYFLYPENYIPIIPAKNAKNKGNIEDIWSEENYENTKSELILRPARNDDGSLNPDNTYNPSKKAGNPTRYKGKLRYQIVSDTQIYKMCGNGWTIEAICHLFSFIPKYLWA